MTLLDAPTMPPRPAVEPAEDGAERRMTLTGISWETYVRLNDEAGPGTRITFDRGRMEIVTLSELHEQVKKCLARLVEVYSDAAGIAAEGRGGWTMRRQDLDRGLEPDECYYVAHAAQVIAIRRHRKLDLTIDPPPDLAIEVDISPPDVAKPPIYAALGVPEIWRYDGRRVSYLVRDSSGGYVASERSRAFSDLPESWVNELLEMSMRDWQSIALAELRRRAARA